MGDKTSQHSRPILHSCEGYIHVPSTASPLPSPYDGRSRILALDRCKERKMIEARRWLRLSTGLEKMKVHTRITEHCL